MSIKDVFSGVDQTQDKAKFDSVGETRRGSVPPTDVTAWATDYWGGHKPDRDAYIGLSHLYVTDSRFAATYGGESNAEPIRLASPTWSGGDAKSVNETAALLLPLLCAYSRSVKDA